MIVDNYFHKDKAFKKENWYSNFSYYFDVQGDSTTLFSSKHTTRNATNSLVNEEIYVTVEKAIT